MAVQTYVDAMRYGEQVIVAAKGNVVVPLHA